MRSAERKTRNVSLLGALMPEVRTRILATVLLQPDRHWYLSQLASELGLTVSTIQRDMTKLTEAGILERAPHDGRVYFRANTACPIYEELRSLMAKTMGPHKKLQDFLTPYRAQILLAFLAAPASPAEPSDLVVVGRTDFGRLIQDFEANRSPGDTAPLLHCYWPEELTARMRSKQPFIVSLKSRPHQVLVGIEDDYRRLIVEA